MSKRKKLVHLLENLINGSGDFESVALEVFSYQAENNSVYREYLNLLSIQIGQISALEEIPFLPIELFKTRDVKTGEWKEEKWFLSSGTGSSARARHAIRHLHWYDRIARKSFLPYFGPPEEFCWVGLLPNYLQQGQSSLVHMVNKFYKTSKFQMGGIFEKPDSKFRQEILEIQKSGVRGMLIGVSFALLDLAESGKYSFSDNWQIIETGGMKGRRDEITREELHSMLIAGLGVAEIGSEYGMTELQSQAWSSAGGNFQAGPLMKVFVREANDPFSPERPGSTGGINIIDLANLDSCSFIMTMDLGRISGNGFEVLGRMDGSDERGCNLMYFDH